MGAMRVQHEKEMEKWKARQALLPPLDSPQFASTYSSLPLVFGRSNLGVNLPSCVKSMPNPCLTPRILRPPWQDVMDSTVSGVQAQLQQVVQGSAAKVRRQSAPLATCQVSLSQRGRALEIVPCLGAMCVGRATPRRRTRGTS